VSNLEIHAIVFRMAADAPLIVDLWHHGSVVAPTGCDPLRDLRMTFQALDLFTATREPRACIALGGLAKRLVGTRNWSWGDLRGRIQRPL
jgi:hypothetical protein